MPYWYNVDTGQVEDDATRSRDDEVMGPYAHQGRGRERAAARPREHRAVGRRGPRVERRGRRGLTPCPRARAGSRAQAVAALSRSSARAQRCLSAPASALPSRCVLPQRHAGAVAVGGEVQLHHRRGRVRVGVPGEADLLQRVVAAQHAVGAVVAAPGLTLAPERGAGAEERLRPVRARRARATRPRPAAARPCAPRCCSRRSCRIPRRLLVLPSSVVVSLGPRRRRADGREWWDPQRIKAGPNAQCLQGRER